MTQELTYLGLALLLVLANGFFVATEFAIVKVRPSRLQALADEGHPGAYNALHLSRNLYRYLSATQVGVTFASLGLGWLGEPAIARLLQRPLEALLGQGGSLESVTHTVAATLGFAVLTFLHILVGELAPKSISIQKAESVAMACAWPMRLVYFVLFPAIWLLSASANGTLKLLGLRPAPEQTEARSEEELRVILASSAQAGAITASRADLLSRALGMLEETARQVLVPRNQVRFLDAEEPLEKNIAEARASGHTWLPVCRGSLDQIEGVLNVKDLFFLLTKGELKSLSQVMRTVLFVPENVTLEQLLAEFRRRKRQMAVVVDEHGGTSGIVTIADVVAELVGDVAELGRKVEEVKMLPGGRLELPGTAPLDDLSDRLGVEFGVPDGEVSTIAGFLMMKLGRVPEPGDKITVGDFEVRTIEVDGPRVVRVLVEPRLVPSAAMKPGEPSRAAEAPPQMPRRDSGEIPIRKEADGQRKDGEPGR